MITENEYENLKQMITFLEKKRDQAAGALGQLMDSLKQDFECESLEQAEKLLAKLQREKAEYEEKFSSQYKQFKNRYFKKLAKLGYEFDESVPDGEKPVRNRKARGQTLEKRDRRLN